MPTETMKAVPAPREVFVEEERGYHKALRPRQIQMIAIGGAIGTGLFLGAGGRLALAGPALVFVYALCGFFAFLVLRALGELIMHRPSSGSFVSYAREFYGEKLAFVAGWMYWLNWAMTSVADVTAVALYMNFFKHYVPWLQGIDQWIFALTALVIVLSMNLMSVKVFGELEFWFSLVKVIALVTFLVVGIYFVVTGTPIDGHPAGFSIIPNSGGLFPNGILPAFIIIQGVVFAYASIELLGTTAGETEDPRKVMPRAIRTVVFRLLVFYVGSVLLLSLLLPIRPIPQARAPSSPSSARSASRGGYHHEPRGPDSGSVVAECRSLFHGPHPAFHGDIRLCTGVFGQNEQERRSLYGHCRHRRRHRDRRHSQCCRACGSV